MSKRIEHLTKQYNVDEALAQILVIRLGSLRDGEFESAMEAYFKHKEQAQ